jgi:hypothetical protein
MHILPIKEVSTQDLLRDENVLKNVRPSTSPRVTSYR